MAKTNFKTPSVYALYDTEKNQILRNGRGSTGSMKIYDDMKKAERALKFYTDRELPVVIACLTIDMLIV